MQCERFESRLNEVLDARQPLSSAGDLGEHIRTCAPCRELARAYEAMLVGLQQAEMPPEPAWLTPRVVSQVRRPGSSTTLHQPRVLYFPRWATVAVAAAAVLVAGIGLPWFFNRGGGLADNDRPTADPARRQRAPEIAEARRPPRNTEVRSIARPDKRRDAVRPAARTPLATAFLDPTQLKADDLIGSLPGTEWAHDVADGLQPVTKPTVGVINGFLQLWGIGEEGRRS
ncbi:MAG TPA: hypothetical protein VG826_14725 [Pirellulales bacterium]|nr:hypothetical protein [Pirellulales bacterium]